MALSIYTIPKINVVLHWGTKRTNIKVGEYQKSFGIKLQNKDNLEFPGGDSDHFYFKMFLLLKIMIFKILIMVFMIKLFVIKEVRREFFSRDRLLTDQLDN